MDEALQLIARAKQERAAGNLPEAASLYEQASARYRTAGLPLRIAHTIRHAADIHRIAGRPDLAEPQYGGALALYRANPETDPLDLANAIRGLALLKNEPDLWREARALYQTLGIEAGVGECDRQISRFPGHGPTRPGGILGT